jgi:hypothetical protein
LQHKVQGCYRGSLDLNVRLDEVSDLIQSLMARFGPNGRMDIRVRPRGRTLELHLRIEGEASGDSKEPVGVRAVVPPLGERQGGDVTEDPSEDRLLRDDPDLRQCASTVPVTSEVSVNPPKKRALSEHAVAALRRLALGDTPSREFNPGVVKRLSNDNLLIVVQKPSIYQKDQGKIIPFLCLTGTGRELVDISGNHEKL